VLVETNGTHTALRRNPNLKISEIEEVELWKGSRGRAKVNYFHSKWFLGKIYKFIVCKFREHTVEKGDVLYYFIASGTKTNED